MESNNLVEEDANLARFRHRYNKLSLIFKFFFTFQSLAIAALIIYLVHDANLESDRTIRTPNPLNLTPDPQSQIFNTLSLQTAAEELDDAVSLILSNYSSPNINVTEFALKNCSRSLQNGSARIREALEAKPFSDETMHLAIDKAEEGIRSCLDDLKKEESTAASEVRDRVLRATVYLSSSGDFPLRYDENSGGKLWSMIDYAWSRALENLYLICVCGLQLLFIFYLLWTLFKFR